MTIDKKIIVSTTIVFLVLIFDQISKFLSSNYFEVVCNEGIAFGLGGNQTFISVLVLSVIAYLVLKEEKFILIVAFSLIFGGGFTNLVDRVLVGCVRDFITIGSFPSFNFADSAITIGAFIILGSYFLKKK